MFTSSLIMPNEQGKLFAAFWHSWKLLLSVDLRIFATGVGSPGQIFLSPSRERKFVRKSGLKSRKSERSLGFLGALSRLTWMAGIGKEKYACWSHLVPNESRNGWLSSLPTAHCSVKGPKTVGGGWWHVSFNLRKQPLLPERGVWGRVCLRVIGWALKSEQVLSSKDFSKNRTPALYVGKSVWRTRKQFPQQSSRLWWELLGCHSSWKFSSLSFSPWPLFITRSHTRSMHRRYDLLTAAECQRSPLIRPGFQWYDTVLPRSTWRMWLLRNGKSLRAKHS